MSVAPYRGTITLPNCAPRYTLNYVFSIGCLIFLSHETLLEIYKQTILPAIDYGSIIWIDCSKVMSDKLERPQNQALTSILKRDRKTCTQWMREKCHLLSLKNRRRFYVSNSFLKLLNVTTAPNT